MWVSVSFAQKWLVEMSFSGILVSGVQSLYFPTFTGVKKLYQYVYCYQSLFKSIFEGGVRTTIITSANHQGVNTVGVSIGNQLKALDYSSFSSLPVSLRQHSAWGKFLVKHLFVIARDNWKDSHFPFASCHVAHKLVKDPAVLPPAVNCLTLCLSLYSSERCQQEIDKVLDGRDQVSFEDRHMMPYVQVKGWLGLICMSILYILCPIVQTVVKGKKKSQLPYIYLKWQSV